MRVADGAREAGVAPQIAGNPTAAGRVGIRVVGADVKARLLANGVFARLAVRRDLRLRGVAFDSEESTLDVFEILPGLDKDDGLDAETRNPQSRLGVDDAGDLREAPGLAAHHPGIRCGERGLVRRHRWDRPADRSPTEQHRYHADGCQALHRFRLLDCAMS